MKINQMKTNDGKLTKEALVAYLKMEDFSEIYHMADQVRKASVGDEIQIRAILEFSNHCRRQCTYCGLNCKNTHLSRFRMSLEEIIDTAKQARDAGYATIVLQSGEDPYYTKEMLGEMVREIKKTGISITLSCGERPFEEYKFFRDCGADRYLLKHETSDPVAYEKLHPCGTLSQRVQCLKDIHALGYETGSGFMIGLPDQTPETIAQDILLLKEIGCHMAGIGPFIPHPDTPLRDADKGSTELTKRAVALTRLVLPKSNLPATTSLGVIDGEEKNDVFSCGANVIMLKVTPDEYKKLYEIYPSQMPKTDIKEQRIKLEKQIKELGKIPL